MPARKFLDAMSPPLCGCDTILSEGLNAGPRYYDLIV
jgi:hypothetical protein